MRATALGLCGLTASTVPSSTDLKKELEPRTAASIKTLNLEDELWTEGRPARPATPAWILPKEYAGFSPAEKLEQLRGKLKEQGCTAQLVGKLDNLAWLLNLRAMDIECTPYAMAYCYVTPSRAVLFINHGRASPRRLRQSWKPTASRWPTTTACAERASPPRSEPQTVSGRVRHRELRRVSGAGAATLP
ncbi:MAG: aminopeptidase P family N-terminal domain-containing protein [Faecalibacterium prausnitzii]